ncbi:MAG TPA: hypothetical protein VIO64_12650 [Pseudobacteroides sp.]|uniref:hypothetical protein n=1 Tax=Pseudobacteroides sp. TaxID=1968840 RepID=UPI002F925345
MNKNESPKDNQRKVESIDETQNKNRESKIKNAINSSKSTEVLAKAIKSMLNKEED